MTIFPKSKMAAAAIFFLRKWSFWPRFLLQGVILHQHTEFDDNPSIHGLEIARWWNPKWRPLPSWISVRWHSWSGIPIYGCILYLLAKFEPNPSILGKVMAIFCKIQDGGRPSFWNCNDVIHYYPRWVFGNVMSVLKFHSNKLLRFEDIQILIFLRLGWDCLTTPPF